MKTLTYVMSDLHGQFELFEAMLRQIDFSKSDELYILGDIIDRGPDPFKIYEYIKAHSNIHMLMGNHEQMFLDFMESIDFDFPPKNHISLETRDLYQLWMGNGGLVTYEQLENMDSVIVNEFIEFVRNLPYYYEVEVDGIKHILCHAKPVFHPETTVSVALKSSIETGDIVWNRNFWNEYVPNDYVVVHGHTPVKQFLHYGNNKIVDIDCGCFKTGKLGCLCLDTGDEIYIEYNS